MRFSHVLPEESSRCFPSAFSSLKQRKKEANFSALNVTQEGTQDCEGIGREMERVAERMGGTTKWPYNDSDCLDAVSWCFRNGTTVTKL